MTTYFVTRHPGAWEWAQQQGITVDTQVDHLDVAQVKVGDVVIGTLSVNLVAEVCARWALPAPRSGPAAGGAGQGIVS